MNKYFTADIVRLTGVCKKSLYNYERIGLIKPERIKVDWLKSKGGSYRVYTQADIDKIMRIKVR